jgi:hypothetical protein
MSTPYAYGMGRLPLTPLKMISPSSILEPTLAHLSMPELSSLLMWNKEEFFKFLKERKGVDTLHM